jgi:membrane protease YdiL (CAAX protease family)
MTVLTSLEGIAPAHAVQPVLLVVAILLLGLGFAAGAGYQVLSRNALRTVEEYRGPSPILCFGIVLVLGTVFGVVLVVLGLSPTGENAAPFVANLVAVALSYLLVVWLLVVRTRSLSWRDMGWPVGRPLDALVTDMVVGAGVTLVAMIAIGIIALAVSALLGGVQAPAILPTSRAPFDVALTAFATVLIAPVGEELFFRGFSLTAWWRDLGPRSALIRSALFFAVVHILNVTADDFGTGLRQVTLVVSQILPLAFVLGWLFIRRGIGASIAGHVTYNAVVLIAALSAHAI